VRVDGLPLPIEPVPGIAAFTMFVRVSSASVSSNGPVRAVLADVR